MQSHPDRSSERIQSSLLNTNIHFTYLYTIILLKNVFVNTVNTINRNFFDCLKKDPRRIFVAEVPQNYNFLGHLSIFLAEVLFKFLSLLSRYPFVYFYILFLIDSNKFSDLSENILNFFFKFSCRHSENA